MSSVTGARHLLKEDAHGIGRRSRFPPTADLPLTKSCKLGWSLRDGADIFRSGAKPSPWDRPTKPYGDATAGK